MIGNDMAHEIHQAQISLDHTSIPRIQRDYWVTR